MSKYSAEDKAIFKGFSEDCLRNEDLTLSGDLYRLLSPEETDYCAYIQVSKDKKKAKFTFLEMYASGMVETLVLRLKGLDPDKRYLNERTGKVLSGATLMNVGLRVGSLFGPTRSDGYVTVFTAIDDEDQKQ